MPFNEGLTCPSILHKLAGDAVTQKRYDKAALPSDLMNLLKPRNS